MRLIARIVVLVGAAVAQSTVLAHLTVAGVKVDLVLLLVVAWSIRRGVEEGIVWALIGGLAVDLLSMGPVGTSIVGFGIAAIVAGSLGPTLRQVSVLLPLILTPLASIIAMLASAVVMAAFGWPMPWPATVALIVLPAAVLDSVAMILVYPIVSAADRRPHAPDWSV
ncbi:MAG: rod shape-determining protein MreD [Chloroflexota bacterium]